MVAPATALGAFDGAPAVTVDLRSPAEFAVDSLPGAHNVPLFDDVERAIIGTLYARRSPADAFREARRRTRARVVDLTREICALAGGAPPDVDLPELVDRMTAAGIDALEEELAPRLATTLPANPLVLYCWRGGLRSRSVVALLNRIGLEQAVGVEGGYKAYRREVQTRLASWRPPRAFVLRGLTGVGKTLVLRAVERLRPGWTLDLEGLAGHRSSILGGVGLEPRSQKAFDSHLLVRLGQGFPGVCVVEGESRKVGDVVLAAPIWKAITGGFGIELVAGTERRVQVLVDEYLGREANREELRSKLTFIEARLGEGKWGGVLVGLIDEHRDAELVEVLLERYYDPLYRHSESRHRIEVTVDATDPERAAREVVAWVEGNR